MKREHFDQFFKTNQLDGNKIIVQDLEGGNLFKFRFTHRVLSEIEYLNAYLD